MMKRTMFVAALLLCLSANVADAQIRFVNNAGWGGGWGSPMYGGYPSMGWPGAWGGGWGGPWQGGWSGWTTYPGYAAVSTEPAPRMRPTLEPATLVRREAMHPRSADDGRYRSDSISPVSNPKTGKPPVRPVGYDREGTDARARLRVQVPAANAELWFEGIKVGQTGLERDFVTPPLDANTKYSYEVRMRWTDSGGQTHNVTQMVAVRAGDRLRVELSEAGELLPPPKPKD